MFVAIMVISVYSFFKNPTIISGAEGLVMTNLWDKFQHLANVALNAVSTVLILLVALVSVKWLITSPSSKLDISRAVSDLPSILALIVIITISLLSLARIDIPGVISNIALVIVGFYFGKAKAKE